MLLAGQMPRPGGDRSAPKEFHTRVNNRHANPPSASSAFVVSPAGDCPVLPAQACARGLHAGTLGWVQAPPKASTSSKAARAGDQVNTVGTGGNRRCALAGWCSFARVWSRRPDLLQRCCKGSVISDRTESAALDSESGEDRAGTARSAALGCLVWWHAPSLKVSVLAQASSCIDLATHSCLFPHPFFPGITPSSNSPCPTMSGRHQPPPACTALTEVPS